MIPNDKPAPMRLLIHEKRVLRPFDTPLFSGWEEVPKTEIELVDAEPKFKWKSAKIPYAMWQEVVGFLRWTQAEFGEEAMVTFFYNVKDSQWAAWAFPQEPNHMTVKMLENHPLFAEDRKQFGKDWIQFGSIHHHCKMGAFQSGTDKTDECDRDGVHITLGKMDESCLDVDIRQVFDGLQSKTNLTAWIEPPPFISQCPKHLYYDFYIHALKSAKGEFPKAWKERIFERTPSYVGGYTPPANNTGQQLALVGDEGSKKVQATRTETGGRNTTTNGNGSWYDGYRRTQMATCAEIAKEQKLTAEEAYTLLSTSSYATMSAEQKIDRGCLVHALTKRNVPILYAEDMYKELFRLRVDVEMPLPPQGVVA
jgi:hypothetical protein